MLWESEAAAQLAGQAVAVGPDEPRGWLVDGQVASDDKKAEDRELEGAATP